MDDDLQCPLCGSSVGYEDVQVDESDDSNCVCPECQQASPTTDWFE